MTFLLEPYVIYFARGHDEKFIFTFVFLFTFIANALTVLPSNSTTNALEATGGDDTYIGTAEKMAGSSWYDVSWLWSRRTESVLIAVLTDQDGDLYLEQSIDGSNWDSSLPYKVTANLNEVHRLTVTRQYYRVRFVNTSSSAQTFFRLQTLTGSSENLAAPANLTISQDADAIVVRSISEELGISEGKRAGHILISKFGQHEDVDTGDVPADIWGGGPNVSNTYTGFPTGAAELVEILSSSANDTSAGTGCRTFKIFGLDANKDLQEETVTLNGTTPVDTVNTYTRVYRGFCVTAGSGMTNAGAITVRHTTTTANTFAVIAAGWGQTRVACITIPNGYSGYIKRYGGSMFDTTANNADVQFWVRPDGGAARLQRPFAVSTNSTTNILTYGFLKYEAKTDLCLRVFRIDNSNGSVTGTFAMVLIKD